MRRPPIDVNKLNFYARFYGDGHRTEVAKQLHGLIVDFCLKANTEDFAENDFDEIDKFLTKPDMARDPGALLVPSGFGFTPAHDALHLPFEKKAKGQPIVCSDELRAAKAQALFGLITTACREYIRSGDMRWEDYAESLTRPNNHKFTLLHTAVNSGDKELYSTVVDELKDLRQRGAIDNATYAAQFTTETKYGSSLLHALNSRNEKLIRAFTDDMKEALTPEAYAAEVAKCEGILNGRSQPVWLRQLLMPEAASRSGTESGIRQP